MYIMENKKKMFETTNQSCSLLPNSKNHLRNATAKSFLNHLKNKATPSPDSEVAWIRAAEIRTFSEKLKSWHSAVYQTLRFAFWNS